MVLLRVWIMWISRNSGFTNVDITWQWIHLSALLSPLLSYLLTLRGRRPPLHLSCSPSQLGLRRSSRSPLRRPRALHSPYIAVTTTLTTSSSGGDSTLSSSPPPTPPRWRLGCRWHTPACGLPSPPLDFTHHNIF